ncbi:MAG: GtrA family protein [Rikenellaceae bacterium]|nr:GtrA family protein [Rikenellaceae bacterium]
MSIAKSLTKFIDLFYIAPLRRIMPLQTFRYGVCGGANLVLDWVLYFVLYNFILREQMLNLGFVVISAHIAASIIEFPITFFTGFWLNRNIVFPGSQLKQFQQLKRYLLVVCGSILLNYICLKLFVEAAHIPAEIAKIITICITVVYSYIMQKHFTFKISK